MFICDVLNTTISKFQFHYIKFNSNTQIGFEDGDEVLGCLVEGEVTVRHQIGEVLKGRHRTRTFGHNINKTKPVN